MDDSKISIVIPAKNEAGGIEDIINSVRPYVDEILVIDGHSNDETRLLAEKAGAQVFLDNKKGKGDAYKVGLAKASHEIVVFIDADGSHEPHDIPKLTEPIRQQQADLVVASRYRGGSDEWEGDLSTFLRSIGSGILSLFMNYRWNANITDCLNGFRAINRQVALKLKLQANDFDIEQHMISECIRQGYRHAEVQSHEYCRQWGQSKLPTYKKSYLFFWRLFLDLTKPRLKK